MNYDDKAVAAEVIEQALANLAILRSSYPDTPLADVAHRMTGALVRDKTTIPFIKGGVIGSVLAPVSVLFGVLAAGVGTGYWLWANYDSDLADEFASAAAKEKPEYETDIFKCLSDYRECRKRENAAICLALLAACIAKQLIPLTSKG